MTRIAVMSVLVLALGTAVADDQDQEHKPHMYPELAKYIDARSAEVDQIPAERKAQLREFAAYVDKCLTTSKSCKLCFICTHNSRRSHMSQLWAAAAAAHYGLDGVSTYSGGTESTAFNPRAVAALKRAGFKIAQTTKDDNPVYHVRFSDDAYPLTCFSKVYNQAPNPKEGYGAVMTCSHADAACPTVYGAAERFAITYEDPKVADNTPEEAAKYDERCAQIARELLYAFSQVKAADKADE